MPPGGGKVALYGGEIIGLARRAGLLGGDGGEEGQRGFGAAGDRIRETFQRHVGEIPFVPEGGPGELKTGGEESLFRFLHRTEGLHREG